MPWRGVTATRRWWCRRAAIVASACLSALFLAIDSAAEDDPWTPALLIDSSPAFRLQPRFLLTQAEGESAESSPAPDPLLSELNAIAQQPTRETVESFEAPVTSLTLSPSTVGKSPAAVFVINQEMIRRSGAQSLPEVLRMAPGVHVGVGNGLTPNVSIRGFGAGNLVPFSSRVLVLIDGRSIYEPIIGGVNWIPNDVVLQDVERIEVIRGPGATIWGANAVNGVINVITKKAADTQGLLVQGIGGSEYQNITVARYGTKVGDDAYLRVFGKFRDIDDRLRDPQDAANSTAFRNEPANDGFHDFHGGFRFDKTFESSDELSVQGRIAGSPAGSAQVTPGPLQLLLNPNPGTYFNGSVQSNWTRTFEDDSSLTLLAIYDRADEQISFGRTNRDSYILDAAYRWRYGEAHRLVAGAQFRLDRDTFSKINYPSLEIAFDPPSRTYNVVSWLLQDEIQIVPDDLTFLAGCKMEVNPFTGFEIQPSGRLLKTIDERRVAWFAVSRAIRRPNRIDEHQNITALGQGAIGPLGVGKVVGNPHLKSDVLVAFESGYRAEPLEWLTWDVAAFCNIYNDLPVIVFDPTALGGALTNANIGSAQSYGAELSSTVTMTESWKVTGAYSYLTIFSQVQSTSPQFFAQLGESAYEGIAPNNLVYLRSAWNPAPNWDVDVIGRYVDRISYNVGTVPSYVEMDLRLAWRPRERLEVAVVGQNLLDAAHPEFGTQEFAAYIPLRTQTQRGVYGSVTYEY
ncbi:MAG: TonB-dependent receptor [Planctomycetaceae bacterium]|nr:TonB-dependent receptor [Planctomycetaceae bacterium]